MFIIMISTQGETKVTITVRCEDINIRWIWGSI